MIRRLIGLALIAWIGGFALFMATLPRPLDGARTDAIVVLTGGKGRIDRGVSVLRAGEAQRMLISGVSPIVRPGEIAHEYHVTAAVMRRIDLGFEAVDTRSNAEETAAWVAAHGYKSVRLVTSDWHMRRAEMELRHALDDDVTVIGDGVPSSPRLPLLLAEYHKLLLRWVALRLGVRD